MSGAPSPSHPGPAVRSIEAEMIRRAQDRDIAAFNWLVAQYEQLAYNLACRLLGDRDLAADATQEAFLSAYQAIRRFRGESLRPWLLRIVANACYDRLRAQKRRPETSLDAMLDAPENPTSFPDPSPNPEEIALRRELLAHVQAGLLQLPVEQRVVVVLFDVQGLSYEEIAEVTETTLGTVKSRLSRGRARLRDYLRSLGELLPAPYR